jgi:protein gp37
MAKNSKIAWCDHTFNPWIGCQKISPGCDHCYAEGMNHRFGGINWGPKAPRRRTSAANWKGPVRWNKAAQGKKVKPKVFCASMADVFDNKAPVGARDDLWALIKATPNLQWILLTKRVGNVPKMLPADWGTGYSNVWLGITVVDQQEADKDTPELNKIPAAKHWLSIEPQLDLIKLPEPVEWVVSGCESGPGRRDYDLDWARGLRDECTTTNIPFFLKQIYIGKKKTETPMLDGQRWTQWP